MTMSGHIDGHAVNAGGNVGAVVEIERAQEILVGLALAGMLRHHQARHGLQHRARPQPRPRLQLIVADVARRRGIHRAHAGGGDVARFQTLDGALLVRGNCRKGAADTQCGESQRATLGSDFVLFGHANVTGAGSDGLLHAYLLWMRFNYLVDFLVMTAVLCHICKMYNTGLGAESTSANWLNLSTLAAKSALEI